MLSALSAPAGQGLTQVGELAAAFVLSAAVGLERELKQKSAGLRTYTVVGLGAALFMLVSKYGFSDVLLDDKVVLDPSRVAAQIVSGLGFIGGGIIFVKRDSVRGLTTAASIWLTAAVGAAAGAGLVLLATLSVVAYFLAILVLPTVARLTRRFARAGELTLRVRYLDGRGLLRELLELVTGSGFQITDMGTTHHSSAESDENVDSFVEVRIHLEGGGDFRDLISTVSELDGVLSAWTDDETY